MEPPRTPPHRVRPPLLTEFETASPTAVDSPLDMTPPPRPSNDGPPLRLFVFDTHRTCAQLFNQLFSAHLRLGTISHPYAFAATVGPERIHTKLQHSEGTKQLLDEQVASAPRKISSVTYNAATERLLRDADRLEQKGKILFVKENASFAMRQDIILPALRSQETIISKLTNPTVIPDELLGLVTPIVFIRHPAFVIPAWWRETNSEKACYDLDDEDVTVWTSLRWTRMVFDYLRSSKHMQQQKPRTLQRRNTVSAMHASPTSSVVASRPYVIDAVDVVNNTHAILSMLCRLLDIDPEAMNQAWTPTRRFSQAGETVHHGRNVMKDFSDRISSPEGIEQSQSKPAEYNVNLDVETKKWIEEFGENIAQRLRKRVEQEMPHYEYLKKFKLQVRPNLSVKTISEHVSGVPNRRRSAVEATPESKFSEIASSLHIRSRSTLNLAAITERSGKNSRSAVDGPPPGGPYY